MKKLILSTILFSAFAFADTITLMPGSTISLTPGQATTVTCGGAAGGPMVLVRYCRCDKSSLNYDWQLTQVLQFSDNTTKQNVIDKGNSQDQDGACARAAKLAQAACN